MYTHRIGLALLTTAGLAACDVSEPYQPPEMAVPARFAEGSGASVGETRAIAWWSAFGDRRLDQLVAAGLSQNLDIRIARERVAAAGAVARGAGVPFAGGIGADAGYRGGSPDDPTESYATGALRVSWVADLFGGLSSERRAAAAELDAAGYGVEAARLLFVAELTAAYIDARFFQESIALTRQTLGSRQRTLDLTNRLFDAASATALDVAQARGLVDETRAQLPVLETGFRRAAHRVSTLMGQPADTYVGFLSSGAPQPWPKRIYGAGVPADLLRNRPDVRIAERDLAAATARIGIARGDLYPSIGLLGVITGTAAAKSPDESTWSFGPIINIPLFGRERLNATVTQREAQARTQMLVWQNTVLRAVEEVQNGVVALSRDRAAVRAQRQAVNSLSEALRLAQESYERGETSLLAVLDAERAVARARNELAAANRRHAQTFVALNTAIGAGRGIDPQAKGQGS